MTTDDGFVSHLAFKREVARGSLDLISIHITQKSGPSLEPASLRSTVSHGGLHLASGFDSTSDPFVDARTRDPARGEGS